MGQKRRLFSLAAFVVVLCSLVLLQQSGVLDRLQNRLTEWRSAAAPRPASGGIVFVAIDAKSLTQIGQWPWPRRVHAGLIDKLVDAGASEIAFDIDFSASSNAEDDALLSEALERAGGAVILAAFQQAASVSPDDFNIATNKPIDQLLAHAWPAAVNVLADGDGIVRTIPLAMRVDGELLPSLPTLLAGVQTLEEGAFSVDFSIDPQSVPVVSAGDVLAGKVRKSVFAGRKVVVGASAIELRDTLAVPVHSLLSGPLLQIVAAETLAQGRALSASHPVLNSGIILIVLAVIGLFGWRSKPRDIALATVTSMTLLEATAFFLQKTHALVLYTASTHLAAIVFASMLILIELYRRRWKLQRAERENARLQRLFAQVIFDNFDAILVCDASGAVEYQGEVAARLLGFDADKEMRGAPMMNFLPVGVHEQLDAMLSGLKDRVEMPSNSGVVQFQTHQGETVYLEYVLTASNVVAQESVPSQSRSICFTARDITSEHKHRQHLEYLATHDQSTNTLTRAALLTQLAEDEYNSSTGVLVLQLEGLGVVKSAFGFDQSEAVVREVVSRIRFLGEGKFLVARLSTTRFAIGCGHFVSVDRLASQAEALIAVLQTPYRLGNGIAQLRCAVGLSFKSPELMRPPQILLRQAELALRTREVGSKRNIVVYDKATGERAERALAVERALWQALKDDEFSLVFQPQISLSDGRVVGAETLARWVSPTLGHVFPDEFIHLAEANGAITVLGETVLRKSCQAAVEWPDSTKVSVNISAIQLTSPPFIGMLKKILTETGLAPNRLTLELTETVLLNDLDRCIAQLQAIRDLGVKIALDDFGTGYSSLQYLDRLPIDILKIDKAFVKDLGIRYQAMQVLESIIRLGHSLGKEICCEGIETEIHAKLLAHAGCDNAQGYFYSKPLPQAEFDSFLATNNDEPSEPELPQGKVA